MSGVTAGRERTGWDILLGVVLIVVAIIILGHTVLATIVSVVFIGWFTLFSGIVGLVAALFRVGKGGFWTTALSGGLLLVLGLVLVSNTGVAAVTLTLVAGAVFLVGGVTRLVAAVEDRQYRALLVIGGIVSALLGLVVLFNLFEATFTLLGVLLGVQTLVEGITLLLVGRIHVSEVPAGTRGRVDAPVPRR